MGLMRTRDDANKFCFWIYEIFAFFAWAIFYVFFLSNLDYGTQKSIEENTDD
jgi:hypothetical protein